MALEMTRDDEKLNPKGEMLFSKTWSRGEIVSFFI